MKKTYKTEPNIKEYLKYITPRFDKVDEEIKNPVFIHLNSGETLFLFKDERVRIPYHGAERNLKIPRTVVSLESSPEIDYVVFSEERIIATDKTILTRHFYQPRFQPQNRWLLAYKKENKYFFIKSYRSQPGFKDFLVNFIIKKDINSLDFESGEFLSPFALDLYSKVIKGVFDMNSLYKYDIRNNLKEKEQNSDSIMLNYKINKFMERYLREAVT